jgi:hypothetical protein
VATQVLKLCFIDDENFKAWLASHSVLTMTTSFDFHTPQSLPASVAYKNRGHALQAACPLKAYLT